MVSENTVIQFVALLIYSSLIVFVIRSSRSQYKGLFLVYLFASAAWSLSSYVSNHAAVSINTALFWGKLIPPVATWSIVSYNCFLSNYVHRHTVLVGRVGYGYVLLVFVLSMTGLLQQSWTIENGIIIRDYRLWMPLLMVGNAFFLGNAIYLLVRSFKSSTNADHRNRIFYLLIGLGLMIIIGSIGEIIGRTMDHAGHLANAILIAYTVLRYKLLDVKLVIRKSLVYGGISVFVTACCLILVSLWFYLLNSLSALTTLAVTISFVVLMAIIFNPLRTALEKWTSLIFYGKSYNYRQTLLNFSSKMSNILDLEQLAEAMLFPLTNAVKARQASLLFANQAHFTSEFAQRYEKGDPVTPIALRKDGPIILWLKREEGLLTSDIIAREPEFKGMREEDRNALEAAEVEILCPIKNKQKLIAVLALSKKQRLGFYSRDDTDLVMTLALGAAVAIENADLYEKAKQRANTDELTELFNHRFFHQRLDEELSRSSRFGNVFSLLFMDIDMFKTYNDVYGHLAGDEILKNIGKYLKSQVRDTDICFRYGGDEFAIIMPETPADGVYTVAERLRKGIQSRTDWLGDPITVSIGVASWPTDGVIKEDIIHSSDAALYYAKQTGKNRTCLACEVALSDVFRIEADMNPQTSDVILSTIYALASTVDAKDHYTYGHSKKVAKYATAIAEALGYKNGDVERIRTAALLHDIGKIGISDRLLQKKESLTPDEWELIRAHPDLGVSIIKHIKSLHGCLAAVQYHHEYYDGCGYPSGLKGNNIPLDARILAVSDAFDAITSVRPYREKGTFNDAIMELKVCSGTQFDPEIVDVFIQILENTDILTRSPEISVQK